MLYTSAAFVSAACCLVNAAWWVSSSKGDKGKQIWMGKSKKTKKKQNKKNILTTCWKTAHVRRMPEF